MQTSNNPTEVLYHHVMVQHIASKYPAVHTALKDVGLNTMDHILFFYGRKPYQWLVIVCPRGNVIYCNVHDPYKFNLWPDTAGVANAVTLYREIIAAKNKTAVGTIQLFLKEGNIPTLF